MMYCNWRKWNMVNPEFILAPTEVKVTFALLPPDNALNSLSVLCQATELSGLGDWIMQTYKALPQDILHRHTLVFYTLYSAIEYQESFSSFEDYLDYLNAQDAETMRQRVINEFCEKLGDTPETLLADKDTFLRRVNAVMGAKYTERGMSLDVDLYTQTFDLLHDANALKQTILNHLRQMWQTYLKPEWEAQLPTLQESVSAFSAMDYRGLNGYEAARTITGRDIPDFWSKLNAVEEVIFVPSAHLGPYVSMMVHQERGIVFFGARIPRGAVVKSSALGRSELLVRLNALTDDTRLMILELLTMHEELCAQDIMTMLNLSQSSASRHLRQLTATGYLNERRRDVAKCYTLNLERVDDTLEALKHFLRRR
ncbi:MAG: metalloregulator ArsR/SmtB family transcription factor [Anaerolineae bacterium]|nr:metalloregulator ArsR/SmtB family transcription factor [Anaerolineae bacterium]